MTTSSSGNLRRPRSCFALMCVVAALLGGLGGCAAMTNPVGDGVPVRHVSAELLGKPKDGLETIPLSLLGQPRVDVYRLAPEDVLGVWIEGVLGDKGVVLPVYNAPPVQIRDQRRLPPAAGYPVPVREDGSVALPLLTETVPVQGLSLAQAEDAIRNAYTKKGLLPAGPRILVTLLQPRVAHVVVVRQESLGTVAVGDATIPASKRGTGSLVDLPAYENDVLHALMQTGGLPGLDDYNSVIIHRAVNTQALPPATARLGAPVDKFVPPPDSGPPVHIIQIPLRLPPGAPMPFTAQDVILHSGDVVFLEARDRDVFYTGGLMPPGQYVLPRDYDLRVVEAITRVKGPLVNGAYGTNTLAGNVINPGIGNPSPSLLSVLRRTPDGGRMIIRVNLNRAMRDPHEDILVLPGDMLILQEQPSEALTRYFTQTLLNFTLTWQAIHSHFLNAAVDVNSPQNIPGRIGITNFRTIP